MPVTGSLWIASPSDPRAIYLADCQAHRLTTESPGSHGSDFQPKSADDGGKVEKRVPGEKKPGAMRPTPTPTLQPRVQETEGINGEE